MTKLAVCRTYHKRGSVGPCKQKIEEPLHVKDLSSNQMRQAGLLKKKNNFHNESPRDKSPLCMDKIRAVGCPRVMFEKQLHSPDKLGYVV